MLLPASLHDRVVSGQTAALTGITAPAIWTAFVAAGSGFHRGQQIERFENIHIYPLLAELLNLELLTEIDGRADVLRPILKAN